MKKSILALIGILMVFLLAACSNEQPAANENTGSFQIVTAEPIDTEQPQEADPENSPEHTSDETSDAEDDQELPYWEDGSNPWGPTESIASEETREQIYSEYQEEYELIKSQPWATEPSDTQVTENIPLLTSVLSQIAPERTPRITYAHMKVTALTEDIDTYLGELIFWAYVSIDGVEEIPEGSEQAVAINDGNPFCIVRASTKHAESILLYVMSPDEIQSWYRAGETSSIKGWVVGVAQDAIVLCVPKLSGG